MFQATRPLLMVERSELAGQVERLGIGGRGGGDHPDAVRRDRDRRQYGDGFEPGARRLRHIPAERQLVGEEDRVEQRRLGALRQILVVANVGQRQWRGVGMPPRGLMMATAVDEQVQVQLPLHRVILGSAPHRHKPARPGRRRTSSNLLHSSSVPGRAFGMAPPGARDYRHKSPSGTERLGKWRRR